MKLGNYEVEWQYYPPKKDGILTLCRITTLNKNRLCIGDALCCPQDQFIKDIGRKISLARAMSNFALDKQERTQIWKDYFNRKKS